MCGLVGIVGNTFPKHSKAFRNLLIFDQVRGFDSTGVVTVPLHKGQAWEVEKELGGPSNLWEYGSNIFKADGTTKLCKKAMLGHNRAATRGAVTSENAHPFEFENIVGMHNGSLTHWDDLEGAKDFDVDSKALLKTIDEKGIEHTWKSFNGAAAIVWWDKRDDTLNFIRNEQRPLKYTWNKANNVLYYASEFWMIQRATEKADVDIEKNKNKVDVVYNVEAHHHYKFEVTMEGVKLLSKTKMTPRPEPARQGYRNNSYYGGNNVVGFTSGSLVKPFDWAKNLKRAPKFYKNKLIINPSIMTMYSGPTKRSEYVKFYFQREDITQTIQVFQGTRNTNTIHILEKLIKAGYEDDIKFKLLARPKVLSTDQKGKPVTLRSSFDYLEISVSEDIHKKFSKVLEPSPRTFRSYYGKEVTKEIMEQHLKDAGSTCAWCSNSLTTENSNKYAWIDKQSCLCEDCASYGISMGYGIGV